MLHWYEASENSWASVNGDSSSHQATVSSPSILESRIFSIFPYWVETLQIEVTHWEEALNGLETCRSWGPVCTCMCAHTFLGLRTIRFYPGTAYSCRISTKHHLRGLGIDFLLGSLGPLPRISSPGLPLLCLCNGMHGFTPSGSRCSCLCWEV